MTSLNATQLAQELSLSKARISQLVTSGKLSGCYHGEGRARRFDLAKVSEKLQLTLDPGQALGNGAETMARLRDTAEPAKPALTQRSDAPLRPDDEDGYKLAKTQLAQEEARKRRRENEMLEGSVVLASEVAHATSRIIAQEISQFETALRDGARAIADQMGVDFKEARQILVDTWRVHRGDRAEALSSNEAKADLTDAEKNADF